MSQPFLDKLNKFMFKWKDLTSLGVPTSSVGSFLDNETIYKMSPRRFNFYMQVLESITNPNSKVLEKVISRENLTRFQREQIDEKLDTILNYFNTLGKDEDKLKEARNKMNQKLSKNVLTEKIKIEPPPSPEPSAAVSGESGSHIMKGGGEIEKLKEKLFSPSDKSSLSNQFNKPGANKDNIVETYKNDPYYSPSNEKVNFSDRAIFIAITYVVRAVSLFLVEWAIYTGFIKNFVNAFSLYFGMYVSIFLLLVFLTNAKKEDMIFRMVFFYINTLAEDGKGVLRAIVHLICVIMLLPIPYIVKEYREYSAPSVLSFSDKTTILNGVEKFSLYTWILTSIVAIKV